MNLKKFEFFTNRIDYLGHGIHPGHLEVSTETIVAIRRLEYPTAVTEIRSLLGLCHAFCRAVPNSTRAAALLNEKLPKNQPQTLDGLDDDEITALETQKAKLVEPPLLPLPHLLGVYTVDMDA